MGNNLLLIIDMQNVYLPGQPWSCPGILSAWEKIEALLNSKNTYFENVIFTRFLPTDNPKGTWADYNREYRDINENPWMSEMIPACKPYLEQYPLYTKHQYSSYTIPEIQELAKKADHVVLAGVVAECCVLFTAIDCMDAGSKVIYLKDDCAGQNPDTEATVERLLHCHEPMHIQVMSCEDYTHLHD